MAPYTLILRHDGLDEQLAEQEELDWSDHMLGANGMPERDVMMALIQTTFGDAEEMVVNEEGIDLHNTINNQGLGGQDSQGYSKDPNDSAMSMSEESGNGDGDQNRDGNGDSPKDGATKANDSKNEGHTTNSDAEGQWDKDLRAKRKSTSSQHSAQAGATESLEETMEIAFKVFIGTWTWIPTRRIRIAKNMTCTTSSAQ